MAQNLRQIPLVDLKAQYRGIRSEVQEAIDRVLHHAGFILGPEVGEFERSFASYVGAAGAVAVASGTGALRLALQACGIGAGDEVIVPSHTFVATAEAVSQLDAKPVFAEINPVDYTIDPNHVDDLVRERAGRGSGVRAIIPVHLYGHPADMNALTGIGRRWGIRIIEDAAQAHGAELDRKRCGSIGDLACFSFFPGKNLGAYGDAGMVTGVNPDLLDRVRRLRDHGRTKKYEHEEVGWGERMDTIQAAVLQVKLRHLDSWTEARREHATAYTRLLSDAPLQLPSQKPGARHVYHLYVVRTRRRDPLLAHLKNKGIAAGIHYPIPVHRQPVYLKQGYGDIRLPLTETAADEVLSLPMYPELTEEQVAFVASEIKEFLLTHQL